MLKKEKNKKNVPKSERRVGPKKIKNKNKKNQILKYGLFVFLSLFVLSCLSFIFYPLVFYSFKSTEKLDSPYPTKLAGTQDKWNFIDKTKKEKQFPKTNQLVIPKIDVNIEIITGENESTLLKGAWHYADSAKPGETGNSVITAHRFQYGPPNKRTFYLLDKLKIGDLIMVYWDQKEYDYVVSDVYEVEEDQTEILKKGKEEKLTLFTCTPLFSQDKRLVIEAKPY